MIAQCFRLSQKRTLMFQKVLFWNGAPLSIDLSWQPELARYFKTESTDIVAFYFGISENTVFSNAIDSVSFGRWTP
jgi:hypothetical protein